MVIPRDNHDVVGMVSITMQFDIHTSANGALQGCKQLRQEKYLYLDEPNPVPCGHFQAFLRHNPASE